METLIRNIYEGWLSISPACHRFLSPLECSFKLRFVDLIKNELLK